MKGLRLRIGQGLIGGLIGGLLVSGLGAAPAWAQPTEVDASVPAGRDMFTVRLNAPEPVQAFLLTHLELQRYRTLADLDRTELQRLAAQVPANATQLLATWGYMTPQVVAEVVPAPGPSPAVPEVVIDLTLGPRTLVSAVTVQFAGDLANRADGQAQRDLIASAFALKPGMPFTQNDWDEAKNRAMRALTAQRYPAGRLLRSQADIDPAAHTATLMVELDSGPALRLGELEITGLQRYDPQMVRRLAHLAGLIPGSDYSLARVLDAQKRLAESGYFQSVFVMVEPGDDPDHAPVHIKVREMLVQKLVVGVGGSTDSGARLSLEHTHHSVPGLQWRAVTGMTWSRNNPSLQASLTSPVDDAGWRWLVSGLYNRQRDASGVTVSQRLRWGRTQDTTAISRSLFLQYDRARTFQDGALEEGQASVSANFGWTLRRLDDVLFPEKGYSVALEAGSGLTLEQTRRLYVRGRARALSYLPLGAAEQGRLALRGEWGTVWARGDVPVPSTELFLSGGDNTVRGYALRSLGVPQPDGTVNPGRVLGVGSVEWQRPWLVNAQRSAWEQTFFVDVGAVGDRAETLNAKVGVGTGVRYRSPVGPLQLDLAYGLATHRLRLHMTLGFRF